MQRILIGLVRLYRQFGAQVAATLGAQCRFTPTCSEYAEEALTRLPLHRALVAIASRLLRCQPWCEGGVDPVVVERASNRREGPSHAN
jgi:uncharacterized protein